MKLKLDSAAKRRNLMATTVLAGVAMVMAAPVAALAQTATTGVAPVATPTAQPQTPGTAQGDTSVEEVVVTGSILRNANATSLAPLTVVTAGDIALRGETTVSSVIQNLSNNGAGNLPNNFTAGGAFAAGATGASLRGLTTNSTLVLVDGQRVAYYPLADDGQRNFVDLNTIPAGIIDRVETLKEGASSTYGADAIAGVINIITKRSFNGLDLKVEGGAAEHGGAGEVNATALFGHGDLNRDGYNFYVSTEYEKDDILRSNQRGFPYNTNNFGSLCGTSIVNGAQTCRTNGIVNGIQFNNTFAGVGTDIVPVVRPYNATNTTALGNYQLLNPAGGCGGLTPVTVTPTQAAGLAGFTAPVTLCQQDFRKDYSIIAPEDERFSVSGRFTMRLGDRAEAYIEGNYYQNDVNVPGAPSAIRATTTPAATGLTVTTGSLALPVYVCPTGSLTLTCSATSPGATLNPNNPFAAAGNVARIFYSFGDIPKNNEEFSQAFRIASGINGDFDAFGGTYHYDLGLTGSQTDLRVTADGYLYYPNLIAAVNNGSYNFVNPSANTAATRAFISPESIQDSRSQLVEAQANIRKDLFNLPGGPVQLGIGASVRYEAVNNPSANDDSTGAANRYFTINPFGATGSRDVESVYFEADVPVIKQLDLNFSGRYDSYSSGQSHFSPKVSGIAKPFEGVPYLHTVSFRATYSEGFRIPSFAESFAVPNTGFVTVNAGAACNAAHGGPSNTYCNNYSLGLTTVASPTLQPETSNSVNAGLVWQPTRFLNFSADYYRIEKDQVIAPADYTPAIAAYYSGAPIPTGFQVIPDVVDPNFPGAQPRAAFVRYGLQNLDQETTSGYDLAASARFNLPWGVTWTSTGDATYVIRLNETFPDGSVEHFAGTLGPYQTTSASGTPKWRATWQNTFSKGPFSLTAVAYYTDGYLETAEDNAGSAFDTTCLSGVSGGTPATFRDAATPVVCKVKSQTYLDLHTTYQITKKIQLYLDVQNVFDSNPPYDPTTYGASNYNPAWGAEGILGRYFKIGAKASF